mmetsp:Transcript_15109/g.29421  ORF Transcript_15109/g.29421 Transcript_15109/m.29421 type:complete len:312 (+) Transcript_15109:1201-2136(+)
MGGLWAILESLAGRTASKPGMTITWMSRTVWTGAHTAPVREKHTMNRNEKNANARRRERGEKKGNAIHATENKTMAMNMLMNTVVKDLLLAVLLVTMMEATTTTMVPVTATTKGEGGTTTRIMAETEGGMMTMNGGIAGEATTTMMGDHMTITEKEIADRSTVIIAEENAMTTIEVVGTTTAVEMTTIVGAGTNTMMISMTIVIMTGIVVECSWRDMMTGLTTTTPPRMMTITDPGHRLQEIEVAREGDPATGEKDMIRTINRTMILTTNPTMTHIMINHTPSRTMIMIAEGTITVGDEMIIMAKNHQLFN